MWPTALRRHSLDMFAHKPWDVLGFWSGLHAGGAIVGAVVALAIAPTRSGVPAWRAGGGGRPGRRRRHRDRAARLLSDWLLRRQSVRRTSVPDHRKRLGRLLVTATTLAARRRRRFDVEPTWWRSWCTPVSGGHSALPRPRTRLPNPSCGPSGSKH